ncbi:hypothetical protein [Fimbriiglobus ruber]|uniref:Uncharacterized protein n=1 Tax=Fimbriiglobus ruber TaxID=1908690 RepID=A0A225DG84_9BACT|nr:hypothetical protein [Fimbriiglobus ruber]OWK38654.1 hypothetical protein FRUB_07774 [Fimbriiglobus ruber]
MAHRPKPFHRTGRGWYVQLGKQQIKLCDDQELDAFVQMFQEQSPQTRRERFLAGA